ncbi:hypothetical protein LXL04_012731 [Taraxacum kok-saghyz]
MASSSNSPCAASSNVTKLLNELNPHQREDAVNTLAYEAEMRLRDPVYGCVGVISLLQHQLRQLQIDLTSAKSELSKYQNHRLSLMNGGAAHGLIAPAAVTTHHHQHDLGINLIVGGGDVISQDHLYGHHPAEFFPRRDQHTAAIDVKCTYDATGGGLGQHMQYQQHRAAGSGGDDRRTTIDPS